MPYSLFSGINAKSALEGFGIGVLFMVIALILQDIVQSIPEIYLIFINHLNLKVFETKYESLLLSFPLAFAVYDGLVAGLFQEGMNYIAVDTRARNMAFFIGLGFSFIDLVVLAVDNILARTAITHFETVLIFLNVVASLIFHPGTSMFMKWGQISGIGRLSYLIAALLHSIVDGGLVYVDLKIIAEPSHYIIFSIEYWVMAMAISVFIFIYGYLLLKNKEERPEKADATIF